MSQTQRPDILIADRGALVGVMTSEGRAISKPKGAGFVARIWLENDGDKINQSEAHDRWKNQRSPFVFHHWSKRIALIPFNANQTKFIFLLSLKIS